MDFRNLCSRIDMDSIKGRLPSMPAMPQIRLPKSFPKLRSRRIFRSSREDVRTSSAKNSPQSISPATLLPPPFQPSAFINHTPTRISTISSLMQEHSTGFERGSSDSLDQYDDNTYRSAHSIEDDYSTPGALHGTLFTESTPTRSFTKRRNALTSSPSRMTGGSNSSGKMSFAEKFQKAYKDLSEFRFKNILTKKTVMRKDNIVVDYYVESYEEDRAMENRAQMRRDRKVAENYRFSFEESQQDAELSLDMSPDDSPMDKRNIESPLKQGNRKGGKSVSEQSGDESGMEVTPPKRPARGATTTKSSRARNPPPLMRGISENSIPMSLTTLDKPEHGSQHQSITSSLWAVRSPKSSGSKESGVTVRKDNKQRMRRLTSSHASHEEWAEESVVEKGGLNRRMKFASQQSLDGKTADTKALSAIRENLKRFKSTMSLKRQPPPKTTVTDTDGEDPKTATRPSTSTKDKLVSRLRRLKSRESSIENTADDRNVSKKMEALAGNSPLRAVIASKFQTWKKSLRMNRMNAGATATGDESSPEKQQRSSTLIQKLKYIRSRKDPTSIDGLDSDDGLEKEDTMETRKSHESNNRPSGTLEGKFENAREKTFKKVNDKMQKLQLFSKSQENIAKERATDRNKLSPVKKSVGVINNDDDDEQSSAEGENFEDIPVKGQEEEQHIGKQKIHAAWTTKPILSDSTESEDNGIDYPRVLIHQDNSDAYESTLVIAVTTAAAPSPKPRITEISTESPPETASGSTPKKTEWISNRERVSGFLEITPPTVQKIPQTGKGNERAVPSVRRHARNPSVDSNTYSDSWITESLRNKALFGTKELAPLPTGAGLNSIQENEEPWRVHSVHPKEKFYKNQSIDIFDENEKRGGVLGAFEDFDDQLMNEPVLKVIDESQSEDEIFSRESSDNSDAADDDNSSRITKICMEDMSEGRIIIPRPITPDSMADLNESLFNLKIGDSSESLDANFDENEDHFDNDYDYDGDDDNDDDTDRPPSVAPSPPPSFSPPLPPLPTRTPLIIRISKPTDADAEEEAFLLPPLPATRPPPPPLTRAPPQIPDRSELIARIVKPLVKTASLRLTHADQVKPSDVGKVNKLISRFEQPGPGVESKRRIRMRTSVLDDSKDDSDDMEKSTDDGEDDSEHTGKDDDIYSNSDSDSKHGAISTSASPPQKESCNEGSTETVKATKKRVAPKPDHPCVKTADRPTAQVINFQKDEEYKKLENGAMQGAKGGRPTLQKYLSTSKLNTDTSFMIPKLTLTSDDNLPQSRASSEYGSPLEYPSSLIGSADTTPTPDRKQQESRSPRPRGHPMLLDEDQYFSFDSDDENSYYSMTSARSHYVVEI